jgi:hypothetical protein
MKGSHSTFLSLKGFDMHARAIPTTPSVSRVNKEVNWTMTVRIKVEGTEKAHKGAK